MIKINSDKCIGCMRCVRVCPFKVLDDKDGKPAVNEDKMCIKCLHCAAACPVSAVSLDDIEGVLPVKPAELPENFAGLIESGLMMRRSYRHFKPEPVSDEILSRALKVSAWAPSAKNQHPTKWVVVRDKDRIMRIMEHILDYVKDTGTSPEIAELYKMGYNVVMGNARTLILAYAGTDAINPLGDSTLALYNTELMLQAQGIGTCWAGYLTRMCNQIKAIRDMLELPEGCVFCCALMAGYPENEEYIHIPSRHKQPDVKWL